MYYTWVTTFMNGYYNYEGMNDQSPLINTSMTELEYINIFMLVSEVLTNK